jgi:Flp pilus assembly protein TadD
VPDSPARLYRFEPRLTPAQRKSSLVLLVAADAIALAALGLGAAGILVWMVALPIAIVCIASGALGFFVQRGAFAYLREPREYRDALKKVSANDRAGALVDLEKAVARAPASFAPWTLRGLLLSESGDFDGALAAYREAIQRNPDSWIGHSGAGAALLNLGRLPEAVEALGRALALGANWPVPRYQLGLALFLRGEYAGAAEALGEALALGLDAPNVQLVARALRAWALEKTGSLDAAREEQERARPLRSLDEIGAFRDRLRGVKLSPVGKLAAWAVGVDTSDEPPRMGEGGVLAKAK